MVTITADNHDEVIKQARAEKRRAKKQATIDAKDMSMSYLKADAALGRIARYLYDENMTCFIWEHKPNMKVIRENTFACTFETEEGSGECEYYRYEPVRVFLNGNGFAIGIEVRDMDLDTLAAYAIGVHNGKVAMIDIPAKFHVDIISHLAEKAKKTA